MFLFQTELLYAFEQSVCGSARKVSTLVFLASSQIMPRAFPGRHGLHLEPSCLQHPRLFEYELTPCTCLGIVSLTPRNAKRPRKYPFCWNASLVDLVDGCPFKLVSKQWTLAWRQTANHCGRPLLHGDVSVL